MHTRSMGNVKEFTFATKEKYGNPFWDLELKAQFVHSKSSISQTVYGFYDGLNEHGEHVWKVRWTPVQAGEWHCNITAYPKNDNLNTEYLIQITEEDVNSKGFVRANAGQAWGLHYDDGSPYFLFGDTMYNIFGAQYCGVDVQQILRHRRDQGINYIRARLQVSPYHPETRNAWQTKDCWPWGGSSQLPDFSRFNLDYFHAVDEVVSMMADMDMGLEMIFEAWLWEFPFNNRNQFITEYEEHWFKYIVSRYAAFRSVYIWCPANEYEFYPVGEIKYHREADRWLKRLAGLIRKYDPYRHPIGAHNWEQNVPIYKRIGDIEDIDVYLVQTNWGVEFKFDRDASLCMWLEQQMKHHSPERDKVVICAEFGYEKVEGLYTAGGHQRMDHHHTRRGQWRAGFSGYPVVHGFDNTWGAHMTVERDAIGAAYLSYFFRFMNEELHFHEMSPAAELLPFGSGNEEDANVPLCLANSSRSVIAVYFPTKGECELHLNDVATYRFCWFNPRTGVKSEFRNCTSQRFVAPATNEGSEAWGDDWVLLLECNSHTE
jgi:hypothetical protein